MSDRRRDKIISYFMYEYKRKTITKMKENLTESKKGCLFYQTTQPRNHNSTVT